MQLPLKNGLILCTFKLYFHAFHAPVQFNFTDEDLLNFCNFLIKIIKHKLTFQMIQKELHKKDVNLTGIYF